MDEMLIFFVLLLTNVAFGVGETLSLESREDIVFQLKLEEQTGRYHDMVRTSLMLAEMNVELNAIERNLTYIAHKEEMEPRRIAWKRIRTVELGDAPVTTNQREIVEVYGKRIEQEIKQICQQAQTTLTQHLIPSSTTLESKVLYYTMVGDYYGHLADISTGQERQTASDLGLQAYRTAYDMAFTRLAALHLYRLRAALHLAIFYHDILNKPENADRVASSAMEDAMSELDSMGLENIEVIMLLQQIKNILKQWSEEENVTDRTAPTTTAGTTDDTINAAATTAN